MNISGLLDKLMRRETLSIDEASSAMVVIMSGEATPAQVGALLVGLTMKGERPAEIAGLARTMRANALQLHKTFDDVFDTCGTGGDGAWHIEAALVGQLLVNQIVFVLMGSAFGALLMNSPLAIVLYFAIPTVWTVLGEMVKWLHTAAGWVDINMTSVPLSEPGMTGEQFAERMAQSERLRHIPAIFISASVMTGSDGQPSTIGRHPAFGKPFDLAILKRTIGAKTPLRGSIWCGFPRAPRAARPIVLLASVCPRYCEAWCLFVPSRASAPARE